MNQLCPVCGRSTQVNVTVHGGGGRVVCPHCTWDDTQTVGPKSESVSDPQERVTKGIQVIGGTVKRGTQIVRRK